MNTENTLTVIRSCLYLYILFNWLAFLSHFACLNALESIQERTDPLDTDPVSKLLLKATEPLSLFNLKPCSTSCRKKLYLENFEKSLRKTQLSAPVKAIRPGEPCGGGDQLLDGLVLLTLHCLCVSVGVYVLEIWTLNMLCFNQHKSFAVTGFIRLLSFILYLLMQLLYIRG